MPDHDQRLEHLPAPAAEPVTPTTAPAPAPPAAAAPEALHQLNTPFTSAAPPPELGSSGVPFDEHYVPGPGERINWPPNYGALGAITRQTLPPGTELHRVGNPLGGYFSPANATVGERALPPTYDGEGQAIDYLREEHFYQVGQHGFDVNSATVRPAFNQVGMGTQYQSPPPAGFQWGPNARELTHDGVLVEQQANYMSPATPVQHAEVTQALRDYEAGGNRVQVGPLSRVDPSATMPTRVPASGLDVPQPIEPAPTTLPEMPLPAASLLQRASQAIAPVTRVTNVALPILGAASTGYSFLQHARAGHDATERGDADAEEDSLGESEMDLAGMAPGVGLLRTAHDYASRRWGDHVTLGQRVGRSGPHSDVSDIEAADRLGRGDTDAHAPTGNDPDRVSRNRAHEADVQAQMARLRQQHAERDAAQAAEHERQFPHGDPAMDRDVVQLRQQHGRDVQRAATYDAPPVTVGRFSPIAFGDRGMSAPRPADATAARAQAALDALDSGQLPDE